MNENEKNQGELLNAVNGLSDEQLNASNLKQEDGASSRFWIIYI